MTARNLVNTAIRGVCVNKKYLPVLWRQSRSYASDKDDKPGWFNNLLVRKIEPTHKSHSMSLSDKDIVYELQMHSVKPEDMQEYLDEYKRFVQLVHDKDTGAELAGSWTVEVGDQDEAIHLWKYPGGYPTLNKATEFYRNDKEFIDFRLKRNKMLRYRKNQILLAFSFWGDVKQRPGKNIYELRSYTLKPGTLIEWGNNWGKYLTTLSQSRGITYREEREEAIAGLFSSMGPLYTVHHVWAYENLQSRKEVREAAWQRPGWDECVAYTVPLIRHMTSRILIPTPFSPLQ